MINTFITHLPERFVRLAENDFWGEPMNIKNVGVRKKRTSDSAPSVRSGSKILLAIAFVLMSLQLAGCSSLPTPDIFDGTLIDKVFSDYRDNVWARRACNLRYSNCNRPYASHFESGFEAGYVGICNGGDGYVPATPPECYWGFDYQTPDGAQCVNAWFEGYPAGVAAAKRDHAGTYRDVFVSRMIQSAIKQDNATKTTPQDVPVVKPENKVPLVTPNGQPRQRQAALPNLPSTSPVPADKSYIPTVVPTDFDYGASR